MFLLERTHTQMRCKQIFSAGFGLWNCSQSVTCGVRRSLLSSRALTRLETATRSHFTIVKKMQLQFAISSTIWSHWYASKHVSICISNWVRLSDQTHLYMTLLPTSEKKFPEIPCFLFKYEFLICPLYLVASIQSFNFFRTTSPLWIKLGEMRFNRHYLK